MPNEHFYCLDFFGELAPQAGYEREGITGNVYAAPMAGTVPIFRWFHPGSGDHFYCTDPAGELAPQAGYTFEGIGWYMYGAAAPNTVPLFRWYSPGSGDHFYTTDPNGEVAPQVGYQAEGILGYLHPNAAAGTVPLYRWYQSGRFANFTFDSDITDAQRARLLERHTWAYFQAGTCGALTAQETADVRAAYDRAIRHSTTTANVNGSATVGGSRLWINFNNLFPLGDDEIAQTLLHEMMHCAGYTHPARIDPPAPNADVPGDNGKYYGTPPLRAELCIAGQQSDAGSLRLMLAPRSMRRKACPVVEWTAANAELMRTSRGGQ